MKTIVFISFMAMTLVQVHSQANLVFNQVISQSLSISGPISTTWNSTINSTQTFTVPTGKVWKIENVSYLNDNWQWNASCGTVAS